jgi:hypothetical protein
MRALMRKKEKSEGYNKRAQLRDDKKEEVKKRQLPHDELDDVFKS